MTTFLLLVGDSSLVYLPSSRPPIAVPAAEIFLPPTPLSFRFWPCPLRAARAQHKPPLSRRLSLSMLLPSRALQREPTPPRSRIWPHPPFRHLATRHLRRPCHLRAPSSLGRTEEQPLPLPLSRLLLIMTLRSGGAPRPSARRANAPPRVPRPRSPLAVVIAPDPAASPAPTVPIPSGRDRTEPMGTSF